jgi:aspartyl aminopeptidase
MNKIEKLSKKLKYERQNFWKEFSTGEQKKAFKFCEGYKQFLDNCKTDRESIVEAANNASKHKFTDLDVSPSGKKVFRTFRKKNAALALIGKKPISAGVNLIVSHIDAPRVDLKQNPLYEDSGTSLGMMRTHYYGGVKKYQWMSTPLALHGVFIKSSGEVVNISIGEDEQDPVFVMPDLLPHLAGQEQYSKKIGEAINASAMNLVFSSMPYLDSADENIKEAVKLNALVLLNEKYGLVEENFLSAELELVPAGKTRDCGLDKSMVLGYGQDDRVCAYTSLEAVFNCKNPERTAIVYLADKEEIGSESNTGAKSVFILDFIGDLLKYNKENYDSSTLRKTLINSQIISADVNAAINPNYPNVHEAQNAVRLGSGVSVTKYTGSRGKSGSNDANAEFNAKIIALFNREKVNWQTGTLGKVDVGGGGTIAKFMAQYGAEVIDCGPGVLGMHSLFELTSKADVFSTYRAYKAFFEKA